MTELFIHNSNFLFFKDDILKFRYSLLPSQKKELIELGAVIKHNVIEINPRLVDSVKKVSNGVVLSY